MSVYDDLLQTLGVDTNELPDSLQTTMWKAICEKLGVDTSDMEDNLITSYCNQICTEYCPPEDGGGGGGSGGGGIASGTYTPAENLYGISNFCRTQLTHNLGYAPTHLLVFNTFTETRGVYAMWFIDESAMYLLQTKGTASADISCVYDTRFNISNASPTSETINLTVATTKAYSNYIYAGNVLRWYAW